MNMAIGSISDWAMVVITGITAYFLYKTLKSQKDVQRTQNELFKIENKRFRESIKPKLKCEPITGIFHPSDDKQEILTIKIYCEEGKALNISIHPNDSSKQIFMPMSISEKRNHLEKGDNPLIYNFLLDDDLFRWILFELKYEDVAGYKYKQRIICFCTTPDIEINVGQPEEDIED